MATFSVDITDVVFAGSITGHKDITITGMPAGGVTVSLTGDAEYFTYANNPDSKGTNVYRVSTKYTNTSSSGSDRTATFKIVNTSDSTDYVNVSLKQYSTSSYNGAYVRYVISNYSDIYGHTYNNETDIYFPYSLSDSTAKVELYVDGSISEVRVPSWASYVNETAYTDTGFSRLLISCTNNYNGPRDGYIKFRTRAVGEIYQNGSPSSTSGCTQSLSFLKSGGTQTIELKIPSSYNVSDINYSTEGDYMDSLSISKISDTRLNFSLTVGNNNTGNDLRGLVKFNGGSANEYTYLGHTIVTQSAEGTPSPTLTVDPSSLTYPASGGAIVLDVTYSGTLTTSEFPSWLTYETVNVDSTHRSYTITASKNSTTSIRSFNLELSDSTMSLTVPITQEAGKPAENISVSPSSLSFSADAGSKDITFRYGGDTYSVDAKEVYTWTTVSLSDASTGLATGTVSVSTNTSTSSRRGNIYFSSGSESIALPIEQAGISFALSAEPSSLNIPASGGSVTTAVTYTGALSAASLPSWLSETHTDADVNHRTYTITAASNKTTSSRTFNWRLDDSYNHIWVYFDQAAAESVSLSIRPTSNSVSSSSGSVQITVTSSGISNVQYSISDSWITYSGKSGNVYTFNYESKTSTGQRTGTITFSGGGLSKTYTLTQEGASADSITVNKNILSVVNGGGYFRTELTVTYTGKVTVSSSSWITGVSSFPSTGTYNYSFSVSNNTETESGGTLELRKGYIKFTGDNGTSCRVDIYQGGKTYGKRPICIPDYTLGTYPAKGGQKYLVIDYYDKLTYTGVPSWITLNIVDGGTGATESIDDASPVIFSVEVGKNESSKPMEATMVFQGGDSLSLKTSNITVYQEIGFPPLPPYKPGSLNVYPNKLRYYGEGGSIRVSFTNRPEGGIGYEIIYTDGSDWLSVTDSVAYKEVTATKNSGIRRRASIKFYDVNDSKNYVIVPVIQGNIDGYDSIWMDELYYPENRNESGNYYYRIVNQKTNAELFTGISVIPVGYGENIGGIDTPRLVDGYISSNLYTNGSSDWSDMYGSYITVDIYNMTENGYPGVVDATFKYCNDWSRFEKRYDYTRSLNDPINGKGCDNMIIPFCVYYDDAATFSIVDTEKNGNVNTYTLSTPSTPFAMRTNSFYDTKKVEYKQDDEVIFSYDMDHCGPGAFIYRNRFGGWDSFLIEGNIIKTDNYTKLNYRTKGEYNQMFDFYTCKYIEEKHTDNVSIDTTYEAYTGWLSDEEAERLVFHLLSSPMVFFQDLHRENKLYNTDGIYENMPIRITASSAEYKKFRNGKKMVNYLITFEKGNIEKVRD